MVTALTEASGALVDQSPNDATVLDKIQEAASHCEPLCRIADFAQLILDEQGFVQVRGVPLAQVRSCFLALASQIGHPYIDPAVGSAIIPAHVRPGELLMGNQLRKLALHTDYSMMEQPPRLTISYCVRPDSVPGFGGIFVADIEPVVFGNEADPRVQRFKSVLLPFAARNAQEEVDVIDKPIISLDSNSKTYVVRYHRSRIRQGFHHRGRSPTSEQQTAMLDFEQMAEHNVQVLHPTAGDITVIDNHRMVHGRDRCSVELAADGTTSGRQMVFLFAY